MSTTRDYIFSNHYSNLRFLSNLYVGDKKQPE